MTNRADDLRSVLSPAEALDIAKAVLSLMAGYPSVRMNREESARLSAAFVAALAALPIWAIRKACENWAAGRVPDSNPAFPPNAVQIKLEADRVAAPRRLELGRIETVLKAEVERLPTEDERARASEHWNDVVRPMMQHAEVTEDLNEKRRQEALDENRRFRAREAAQAGLADGHDMTLDMRRALHIPTQPRSKVPTDDER